MDKSQKIRTAARKTQTKTFWALIKKIIVFPWRVCKKVWAFIVRQCKALWNWLKSIDVVGMVNLTLLVAIIVLCSCLISNVMRRERTTKTLNNDNVVVLNNSYKTNQVNKTKVAPKVNQVTNENDDKNSHVIVRRTIVTKNPARPNSKIVKTIVTKKVVAPANTPRKMPVQKLYGDVIIDLYPEAPVLNEGVNVDGNLYIQNMRKYTLPCDANISGNLFIRNVEKLRFCGKFSVKGNIYVNRQSSFGPIPQDAQIGGQVVL